MSEGQPRDNHGRWASTGSVGNQPVTAHAGQPSVHTRLRPAAREKIIMRQDDGPNTFSHSHRGSRQRDDGSRKAHGFIDRNTGSVPVSEQHEIPDLKDGFNCGGHHGNSELSFATRPTVGTTAPKRSHPVTHRNCSRSRARKIKHRLRSTAARPDREGYEPMAAARPRSANRGQASVGALAARQESRARQREPSMRMLRLTRCWKAYSATAFAASTHRTHGKPATLPTSTTTTAVACRCILERKAHAPAAPCPAKTGTNRD